MMLSPPTSSSTQDLEDEESSLNHNDNDITGTNLYHYDQLQFLESMVSQYESLTRDMQTKLAQNCQDLASFILPEEESRSKNESDNNDMSDMQNTQRQLSQQAAIIANLQLQLEVLLQSKTVCKKLWQTSLQHVQDLEQVAHHKTLGLGHKQPPADFLSKWKALTNYATALEEQVERLLQNLHLHQLKLVEVCGREEKLEKIGKQEAASRVQEETKHLQNTIHDLQSELEKVQTNFNSRLDQALAKEREREREAWEFQEAQSLSLVRVQVEELILDNLAHRERESQLVIQLHKLEGEVEGWKCKFGMMAHLSNASQQLKKSLTLPSQQLVVHHHPSPIIAKAEKSVVKVDTATQTAKLGDQPAELPKIEDQQATKSVEESNNYKNIIELQSQNMEAMQRNALEKVKLLQARIEQLESANLNLSTKCDELQTGADAMQKRLDDQADNEKASMCKNGDDDNVSILQQLKAKTSQTKHDLDELGLKCKNINDKRKDVQITRLSQQVELYRQRQKKLLEVVQEQTIISEKWKLEYKTLANNVIQETSVHFY